MEAPFRFVVVAIIAAALLYIFFTYFAQYYFWPKDPAKQIEQALFFASLNPGKAIEAKETIYNANTGFSIEAFRQQQMETRFECNSGTLCCNKNISCSNPIEWSNNGITFKQYFAVKTFARCYSEHNISACAVYFGQMPAQAEIEEIQLKEEIDLQKENPVQIEIIAKNAGSVLAASVFAKAKLYRKNILQKTKELLEEKTATGRDIMPGAMEIFEFRFSLPTSGNYEIETRVEADNAGFDTKSKDFNAVNAPGSLCQATTKGETQFDSITGKCETSYYCSNCTLAFECKNAWQEKETNKNFETADAQHALSIEETVNGKCI